VLYSVAFLYKYAEGCYLKFYNAVNVVLLGVVEPSLESANLGYVNVER